jgi:glutaminyl-peptide cyclotransferase
MPRLLALLVLTVGCQTAPPAKEIDGQQALSYVRTQLDFGPRVPGTGGHDRMASWLDSLLRTRADSVVVQAWTHVSKKGDSLALRNFLARFNPAGPRRLLFLAHWDTRPIADADTAKRAAQPVPGANDGASGVAVLLAMADALKKLPPGIGVDLLFVDGEDYGLFSEEVDVLIGSKYYARNQPPGPKPDFAVLLDMVGGKGAEFQKEGNSVTGAPGVVDLVWETASRMGYGRHFSNETGGSITDDHIPLQQAGIRAIDVIPQIAEAYPYWHTVDDTLDKLSAETLAAVGNVMMAVIREGRKAD